MKYLLMSLTICCTHANAQKKDTFYSIEHGRTQTASGALLKGKRIGKWLVYDSLRHPIKQITYLKGNNVFVEQFEYGTMKIVATTYGYEKDGKIIPNGQQMVQLRGIPDYTTTDYVDGIMEGRRTYYRSLGHIKYIYEYKNGRLNGGYIYYNDTTGIAEDQGYFKNDIRVGFRTRYYSNGVVKDSGAYSGNVNYLVADWDKGLFNLLDSSHTAIRSYKMRNFNMDSFFLCHELEMSTKNSYSLPINIFFKEGIWKHYDEFGKLVKEELYEENRIIKTEEKNL